METASFYDLVVIGGGASGLSAALAAARKHKSVLVIERDVACGLKILATGNGRCNLSNEHLDPKRYRHQDIVRTVMGEHPEAELASYFDSLGIETVCEDGRLYPRTKRAESVRDALLGAATRSGIDFLLGSTLVRAHNESGAWKLVVKTPRRRLEPSSPADKTELRRRRKALASASMVERTVSCSRCIIAVGGASEQISKIFDLQHVDEHPVLCPIAGALSLHDTALKALDGLRVDARLTLLRQNGFIWSEQGEVLFRAYGISGIAAFDLSRRAERGDLIEIDLFDDIASDAALAQRLSERMHVMAPLAPSDPHWYDGLLALQLAREIARTWSGNIDALAHLCKHLPFQVEGLTEERVAQVTQGGIPFYEIDPVTLEAKRAAGVHICGEALDMDADCGGHNLAWAWISGIRAGTAAAAQL